MLSNAEVLYLQGRKPVSDSYEYKLRSILRKKIANFLNKELPLLTSLFPDLDLTKNSKNNSDCPSTNLTKFSKMQNTSKESDTLIENSKSIGENKYTNFSTNRRNHENATSFANDKLYNCRGNIHQTKRRVRSVVRISRRSSEPQVMGSKPTGPV